MINIDLISQKVTELHAKINFNPNVEKKMEIGVNSPFSISYADDNKHCIATLEQRVVSKENPEEFSIYIKIEGLFDIDEIANDEMKKETHIACYYRLFPYVQSLLAQTCVAAGLPPLMIRSLKMSPDDVILPKNG